MRYVYSEEILGTNLKISQPGATWCWTQTEVVRPLLDRSLTADRLKKHGLSEVVMICLGMRTGTTDYLELQFSHLAETDRNLIAVLSNTLSRTWKKRLPGTAEKQLARTRAQANLNGASAKPILDVDNSSGLSRSEFRVCTMVREGLLVKDIAADLSICEATVRSHLHSIYAKTRVSGQVELLHRLTTTRQNLQAEPLIRPIYILRNA